MSEWSINCTSYMWRNFNISHNDTYTRDSGLHWLVYLPIYNTDYKSHDAFIWSRTLFKTTLPIKKFSNRTPTVKPWVTPELKGKNNKYRYLNLFNRDKGGGKHSNMLQSRKEYQTLAAKLERQYMNTEGNILNQFRRQKPQVIL